MTLTHDRMLPAALGGRPAFPSGLPLMRPALRQVPELEHRLGRILDSGQLTDGPTVRELEEVVAARLGVSHVVAVASCTSGLALTLQALEARGQVVMPSFTFSASAHAVVWAGGRPEFADVEPDTLCLDAQAAEKLVDGAVAMTATHIYGTPCKVERLEELAREAGIPLVFDAAHALGSVRQGRPVGSFGVAEVFSLSPTKVVVAGEGGLVTTNDDEVARFVRLGRNYGNPGNYDCEFPGINARMSELHAAVALHSLRGLDENIAHRNALAEQFWAAMAGVAGLGRPRVDPGDVSTYKDLTVIVEPDRFGLTAEELGRALDLDGVDTRRYYYPAIHAQRAYQQTSAGPLPVTETASQRVLSLPLWSDMPTERMALLAEVVERIHRNARRVRVRLETGRTT